MKQQSTPLYEPEKASDYYDDLLKAIRFHPDYVAVYQSFSHTFNRCVEQQTSTLQVHLSGIFAKTDYLLKEHHATASQVRSIHDTRVRLRNRASLSSEEMEDYLFEDLRNISLLINVVFGDPIPPALTDLFPTHRIATPSRRLLGDSLRMIVESWDDNCIRGQADGLAEGKVTVCYARESNKAYPYDWSYLRTLLREGTQLNLVRPRIESDIIYPELIIVEPDYLVDISSVAKCFENYAESQIVHLLQKIQPYESSEPIVLGNLASQFLDEEIHGLSNQSYSKSVREFFRRNALDLITANTSSDFHKNAQAQKQNIINAIRGSLPRDVESFDRSKVILEPSFFSEMLGLQGRMDLLQTDLRILIEQKSGKGEYPYDHFIIPRAKEQHYVQMLLYMLLIRYNYRSTYESNNRKLQAFLLYSKYRDSLLYQGFAPELVFRAIRVRNLIAWSELGYAEPGGMNLLATLTPDKVNEKRTENNLWNNYQKKQIAELLYPIHTASDLERAYYLRFLTFIAREHLLSKTGNKSKENSGFASIWQASLEDKLRTGNIYHHLSLIAPTPEENGKVQRVSLRFSEDINHDISNFRIGDIVILYPYRPGTEPDARQTMVFRSSIEEIHTDTIVINLRAAQCDVKIFTDHLSEEWAIEHDFFESSYSSQYRGMHAFLSAPKERRDLLMLQREPHVTPDRQLRGDYGSFNTLVRRVSQADDFFLIIGPPGTGKTSFGMLYTLREQLLVPGATVLLLSFTNRAVDEICSKLVADQIPFIRVGSNLTCSPEYREHLLENRVQQCNNIEEVKALISSTRVFAGTTASVSNATSLLKLKQFSLAIIDEASQILEPHLIGLISANNSGEPTIRKFVFIGDHKQLPAVVQQSQQESSVEEKSLHDIHLTNCRLSLFERLLRRYGHDERITYMLTHQGRMHEDIAQFPNEAFYGNALQVVPLPHQRAKLSEDTHLDNTIDTMLLTRRICFVAAECPTDLTSDKVNQTEADIIASIVARIHTIEGADFDISGTVGVIVPYRNQIATVRSTIDHYGIPHLRDITIDTVERFQGSQRKYIIYGFTVKRYEQLRFLTDSVFIDDDGSVIDRKLNVAMTRAKEHLILVGNPHLLGRNTTFQRMMDFIRSNHGYFEQV